MKHFVWAYIFANKKKRYTDAQLESVLQGECVRGEQFPHTASSGFDEASSCKEYRAFCGFSALIVRPCCFRIYNVHFRKKSCIEKYMQHMHFLMHLLGCIFPSTLVSNTWGLNIKDKYSWHTSVFVLEVLFRQVYSCSFRMSLFLRSEHFFSSCIHASLVPLLVYEIVSLISWGSRRSWPTLGWKSSKQAPKSSIACLAGLSLPKLFWNEGP